MDQAGGVAGQKAMLRCGSCGAVKDTKLTAKGRPKINSNWGWKRRDDGVYCRDCWHARYKLAAIVLPIRPADGKLWPELRESLREAWLHTACLANWAVFQQVIRETLRTPDAEKMKPSEPVALYGLARDTYPSWSWWEGQCQAANAILRMAEKRWRQDRYHVLWLMDQAIPTYRQGTPYPLDADAYKLSHEGDGAYQVRMSFCKRRWDCVIQAYNQGRMKRALKKMVSGEALAVEAAIYERRASLGDHRAGRLDAAPGGGNQVPKRLYLKLVAWLPRAKQLPSREQVIDPDKVMRVTIGQLMTLPGGKEPECVFLSASIGGGEPWLLHAEEPRNWIMEYMLRSGKLADNMKYERRWPKWQRTRIDSYRDELVTNHKDRMDSWLKQTVAKVIGFANRARVGRIEYAEAGYPFNPFPWYRLRGMLANKADEYAIDFVSVASDQVLENTNGGNVSQQPNGSGNVENSGNEATREA